MSALAGNPLRTRDTDAIETPARFATVTTVGRRTVLLRVNVFMAAAETLRRRGTAVKKEPCPLIVVTRCGRDR
jgi:hypothetical protein